MLQSRLALVNEARFVLTSPSTHLAFDCLAFDPDLAFD